MSDDWWLYSGATQAQKERAGLGLYGPNSFMPDYTKQVLLQATVAKDRHAALERRLAELDRLKVYGTNTSYEPISWNWPAVKAVLALGLAFLFIVAIWFVDPIWTSAAQLGQRIAGVDKWVASDGMDRSLPKRIKNAAMDDKAVHAAMDFVNSSKSGSARNSGRRHDARLLVVAAALHNPRFRDMHLDWAQLNTSVDFATMRMLQLKKGEPADYGPLYVRVMGSSAHAFNLKGQVQTLATLYPSDAKLRAQINQMNSVRYTVGGSLWRLANWRAQRKLGARDPLFP